MADYPTHVRSGTGQAVFQRRRDLYAVRRSPAAATAGAVASIPDGNTTITIHKGEPPPSEGAPAEVGPVYSAGPDGPLAVPTGRVLVRLSDGIRAEDRRAVFEAAGFRIDQTLSYAPQAAWLQPSQGGVAAALQGLPDLGRLPDVVHVEPQLLMPRALKHTPD